MKKFVIVLIINLLFSVSIMGNFSFLGDIVKYQKYDGHIEFQCTNALFNLYPLQDNLIRFRYTNQEKFSEAPSYAVINHDLKVDYVFTEATDHFSITTDELIVIIDKAPCRVLIYDKNMNLINSDEKSFGVSFDNDEVRCHKTLFTEELFYGLGEKTGNLQKSRNQYTLWNSDIPAYTNKTDAIYQSIPFFIGVKDHKAYGIFFDNTHKSYFNFGASNDRFYWFGAEQGEMDYYFIAGPEMKKVITFYTLLTGRMEMPPKWALGYQQSKWSYYPEAKVKSIASTFRERDIPCDVIYLDIHYMNEYRVFTWDEERFPNSGKMIEDLKKDGFKVITIVDPGVKADTNGYAPAIEGLRNNLFAIYPDGTPYQGEVWPSWSYFPDFTKEETRTWWGEKNADLLKEGIAGIWNDMNEPAVWGASFPDIVQFSDNGFGASHKKIHNVYALEMAKATFDGIKIDNNRPFILTRAGFSGIQRYAAVWTGDNIASEEHLQLACTMPLSMGLSGLSFVGSDVGGFMEEPSANLYSRWIQMGALSPFFRGHSTINVKDKEPWAFGDYIENIARDAIKLRYKLMPYIYNEFQNSTKTGLPVMKPMFLEYQNDKECYSHDAQYQYMFGENLLVAPVVKENTDFKKLYLPKGKWIDYWSNKIYNGEEWIIVDAPVYKIPLFIKEGGIIPSIESQNYIGEKAIDLMEFKIFPSQKSSYKLYEDDGITQNYTQGEFSETIIEAAKSKKELKIKVSSVISNFDSGIKTYHFKVLEMGNVKNITLKGNKLNEFKAEKLGSEREGYSYNQDSKILEIKVAKSNLIELLVDLK